MFGVSEATWVTSWFLGVSLLAGGFFLWFRVWQPAFCFLVVAFFCFCLLHP